MHWGQVVRLVLRVFRSPRSRPGVRYHAGVLNRSRMASSTGMALLRGTLGGGDIFSAPDQPATQADYTQPGVRHVPTARVGRHRYTLRTPRRRAGLILLANSVV